MQPFRKFTNSAGGGGVTGLTSASSGTALADNVMVRGDGTTGIQGSVNTITDGGAIVMANGAAIANADHIITGNASQKASLNRGTGTGSIGLALSSDRSIGISSGSSAESGFDVELIRTAANVWRLGDGASGFAWIQTAGFKRKTADQTVTDSTTLVDDSHLSVSLAAGRSYGFRFWLPATIVATSGLKVALGGTATHTDLISDIRFFDPDGIAYVNTVLTDSTTVGSHTLGVTAGFGGSACIVEIQGTTTVDAAGTFLVQFAQNTETGAAESVTLLRGSKMEVWDIA